MDVKAIEVGTFATSCYIVTDSEGKVYLIDPGAEPTTILAALPRPDYILLTHEHFDHIMAVREIRETYPEVKICVSRDAMYSEEEQLKTLGALSPILKRHYAPLLKNLPQADILLTEGDVIGPFSVIKTPGHTPGSICYYAEDEDILFSGDTLFAQGYGRTDLPGGEAEILEDSLLKLSLLPKQTLLYPGHGTHTTLRLAFSALEQI